MTDDELERALFALPLEEPPADLRRRILGATIHRPRLAFAAWELWLIGTLLALMVWLTLMVSTAVPDAGARISMRLTDVLLAAGNVLASGTALWVLVGVSSALWVSQFSLNPRPRHRSADN